MVTNPLLARSRPTPSELPAARLPNGLPLAPCAEPACAALKRRALAMALEVDGLTVERDALRATLEGLAATVADWGPLGGEAALRGLTGTEARLVEQLLLAGREPGAAEYRAVRHERLLRRVWSDEYLDAHHLLRVNISRIRHKLEPFGWDVVVHAGWGYRLAPHDPTRRPRYAPLRPEERNEMRRLHELGVGTKAIARLVHRHVTTVRDVLRAGRA